MMQKEIVLKPLQTQGMQEGEVMTRSKNLAQFPCQQGGRRGDMRG